MITPDISLTLARLSDAAPISRSSRHLVEYGVPQTWTPRRVTESIRCKHTNVLVARAEGSLAGFGIMRYEEDEAHLNLFGVERAFQRQGVGCRMLQWLEAVALEAGIDCLVLEVRERNFGAQAFYASMGYQDLEYLDGYYHNGEPAMRMCRKLLNV